MIPVLVLIGIFCALYWALMAGHGLAPKVSIRRRPKPKPERRMTRWGIWLLERELEVPTDELDTVMAAINARLGEEDISSDELADMRRASEEILRESNKRLRLEQAKLRRLLPPTARKESR